MDEAGAPSLKPGSHEPVPPELNRIGTSIVSAATKVHAAFGPGLLESAYRACLADELSQRGHSVRLEVKLPIVFNSRELEKAYRLDLLVDECVIAEVKAIDALIPIHEAQLLTYLRLSGLRLGYLLNFNVHLMKNGIRRRVI